MPCASRAASRRPLTASMPRRRAWRSSSAGMGAGSAPVNRDGFTISVETQGGRTRVEALSRGITIESVREGDVRTVTLYEGRNQTELVQTPFTVKVTSEGVVRTLHVQAQPEYGFKAGDFEVSREGPRGSRSTLVRGTEIHTQAQETISGYAGQHPPEQPRGLHRPGRPHRDRLEGDPGLSQPHGEPQRGDGHVHRAHAPRRGVRRRGHSADKTAEVGGRAVVRRAWWSPARQDATPGPKVSSGVLCLAGTGDGWTGCCLDSVGRGRDVAGLRANGGAHGHRW